uniref:Uncharacterized protein n=1 Tax=Panagrolaimus sp. PS1159 TaxID=55785 RepID=A0AC35GI22_9BILA
MPSTLFDIIINNNREVDTYDPFPGCSKYEKCSFYTFSISLLFFIGVVTIRFFALVVPEQYVLPCDFKSIASTTEIKMLEKDRTINETETLNSTFPLLIELKNIKENYIQNCIRQKCAKINIQKNLEKIKEKISTISIWLFRIASVLLLLNLLLGYYKRQLLGKAFGTVVFLLVAPFFINAFASLGDFYKMTNFEVEC